VIQGVIQQLIDGQDLDRGAARGTMDQIMSGGATDAQIGAFLIALRCKGETVDEIAGFAEAMREKATPIGGGREPMIDTCGTGGDGSGTFNISTAVAFVAAGAGLCVAKHGNRAMSSKCGSADVLAALGVDVEASPAIGPRKEIGTRTVFNILGPLTNPAGARRQLIGVFAAELTERMAAVLRVLGSERALVVHGSDGLDELTLTGPSQVTELRDGELETYEVAPGDFGYEVVDGSALAGGDAAENARILTDVLKGIAGAPRDVVVMNAAAAIVAGGLADRLQDGAARAEAAIESGKALAALENLKRVSNS